MLITSQADLYLHQWHWLGCQVINNLVDFFLAVLMHHRGRIVDLFYAVSEGNACCYWPRSLLQAFLIFNIIVKSLSYNPLQLRLGEAGNLTCSYRHLKRKTKQTVTMKSH